MTTPITEKSKLVVNELRQRLQGKVSKVEKFDGQNGPIYETLLILPAPDSYTSPPRFAVRSTTQIGKEGSTVDIVVTISSRYWKANSGKVNHTPELWLEDAA